MPNPTRILTLTLLAAAAFMVWPRQNPTASPQRAQAAVSPSAGLTLFHDKGCVACHGEQLQGTDKGPRLNGIGRTLKREQIAHQIHEGGDNMPAFGDDVVAPDELAILVDFLAHQKQKK